MVFNLLEVLDLENLIKREKIIIIIINAQNLRAPWNSYNIFRNSPRFLNLGLKGRHPYAVS